MDTTRHAPDWIDMKALCQSLLEAYADRAARHRVTIDLALPAEDAFVIGYRDLLRSALDRLVIRAFRAMPGGGDLTLRLRRSPHVVLELSDTGEADVPTTTRPARQILQAHGGVLWRRAVKPAGTCFVMELPAAGPGSSVAA